MTESPAIIITPPPFLYLENRHASKYKPVYIYSWHTSFFGGKGGGEFALLFLFFVIRVTFKFHAPHLQQGQLQHSVASAVTPGYNVSFRQAALPHLSLLCSSNATRPPQNQKGHFSLNPPAGLETEALRSGRQLLRSDWVCVRCSWNWLPLSASP